jgi:hypothetical protein
MKPRTVIVTLKLVSISTTKEIKRHIKDIMGEYICKEVGEELKQVQCKVKETKK